MLFSNFAVDVFCDRGGVYALLHYRKQFKLFSIYHPGLDITLQRRFFPKRRALKKHFEFMAQS